MTYKYQGGYRLFLALCVLWSHTFVIFFPETVGWFPSLQLGNVAVSGFFVLSGYLMHEAVRHFYPGKPVAFICNRYLRIAPPLLAATVFSIAIHFILVDGFGQLVGSEMIDPDRITTDGALLALLNPLFPLNGVLSRVFDLRNAVPYDFVRYTWAIATELVFYWFLFMYTFLMAWRLPQFWAVVFFVVGMALGAIGIVAYNAETLRLAAAMSDQLARIPLIFHFQWAPHFLLGVMISTVLARPRSPYGLRFVVLLTSSAALLQLWLYAGHQQQSLPALVLALYVLVVLGIVWVARADGSPLPITRTADKCLGDLSYPLYINQYALAILIFTPLVAADWMIEESPMVVRLPLYAAFCFVITAASGVLIRLTDSITVPLRDRVRGQAL